MLSYEQGAQIHQGVELYIRYNHAPCDVARELSAWIETVTEADKLLAEQIAKVYIETENEVVR